MSTPNESKDKSIGERIKNLSLPKKAGLGAAILLLVGSSAYFVYEQYKYEATDDAYVQAYSTQLAPKVSGIVTHVLVVENQHVVAGQILLQIDREDYAAALRDATASHGSLEAQLTDAELDYRRMKRLIRGGAITAQAFDRARANFQSLERQARAAEARVEAARLNVEYASVRAPSDGAIARRSIDVGMYVAAGTTVLGFVPGSERWVDANYKETQLSSLVPGRPARVTVDAVSGKTYEGFVESISPATGATFTLLPPDNATGNFTKVIQRVPVRIRLKNLKPEDIAVLQAGLSAEVEVYKHRRPEPLPAPAVAVFTVGEIRALEPPLTSKRFIEGERAGRLPEPEPE